MNVKNPIMPGFYPDPSMCVVGDDFYLVNSSFTYFPGLPVMHSKDLCHWEQIGNVMERKSQLECLDAEISRGLFAPTIRYYEGIFYVICTNVSGKGNFIVTAKDPAGPWSDPYYLEGAEGIDPSLFFDDDGRCYYIGTHENPEGAKYNGDWYIWIQEVDIKEMKLIGEHKNVWNGAMKNIIWPEGPHIYKRNGYYYILHAEGGTGPHHAVTVCRSKNIWGPYENNFCNPILTHRHMGKSYPIQYVGHADLVETKSGDWYAVMLAVRPQEGYTTMGRETFLAKVTWEEDWPVMNAGVGMLEDVVDVNLPECILENTKNFAEKKFDFQEMNQLDSEFLFLRSEDARSKAVLQENGLFLQYGPTDLIAEKASSYLAIRQQHHSFTMKTSIVYHGGKIGQKAGIVYFQNSNYHLRMEVEATTQDTYSLRGILCMDGKEEVLTEQNDLSVATLDKPLTLELKVVSLAASLSAFCGDKLLCETKDVDVRNLSTEVAGGFVGCTMGPYAVWENELNHADGILIKEMVYQGGK